jgi:NAD(P) transhydrogenase subunit beta
MARAMIRSVVNIIVGGFGTGDSTPAGTGGDANVRTVTADDVAVQLAYADKVIVVPGRDSPRPKHSTNWSTPSSPLPTWGR